MQNVKELVENDEIDCIELIWGFGYCSLLIFILLVFKKIIKAMEGRQVIKIIDSRELLFILR